MRTTWERVALALDERKAAALSEAFADLSSLGPAWRRWCLAFEAVARGWVDDPSAGLEGLLRESLDEARKIFARDGACGVAASGDSSDNHLLDVLTEKLELFLPDAECAADAVDPDGRDSHAATEGAEKTMLFNGQDDSLLDCFVAEAKEQLDSIEEGILSLRGDPGAIDRLFRAMHTLKGSSGMLGAHSMNRLAHAAEEILSGLRTSGDAPSTSLERTLLTTKDLLGECVVRIEERQDPEIAVEDAIVALHAGERGDTATPRAKESERAGIAPRRGDNAPLNGRRTATPRRTDAASSIRVDARKLDELFERMGEAVISRIRIDERVRRVDRAMSRRREDRSWSEVEELFGALRQAIEEGDRVQSAVQERVMVLRLAPLDTVFRRFPRTVRETAQALGKEVEFVLRGGEVELDKAICEAIVDPLIHMIRNAIDHGIESAADRLDQGKMSAGILTLSAEYRGDRVVIEMSDDGRGIDADRVAAKALEKEIISREELARMDERARLLLVFRAGFSTAEKVTNLSGRGVGMDVVRETIERLKGSVDIASTLGEGTRVTLSLPLTMALVNLLLVNCGEEILAFPLYVVRETLKVSRDEIQWAGDRRVIRVRDAFLPLVPLCEILRIDDAIRARTENEKFLHLVVVEVMGQSAAVIVTRLIQRCEAVLKPLGRLLAAAPYVSGTTILGDGRVVPVLDPLPIIYASGRLSSANAGSPIATTRRARSGKKILVVEDSEVMARQITNILARAGFSVTRAVDGEKGLAAAREQQFDLISTDIEMPICDGYEFCRRLREDAHFDLLPVIALTTHAEKVDRLKGFESGFDEYLSKPVDEAILLGTIERLLARTSASK